jgi:hypothetical protein
MSRFGRFASAADLELLSTIVQADREATQARRQMAFEELGRKVKQVKPRISEATILRYINELAHDGMLVASSAHECTGRWNRRIYISSDSPAAGERVLSGLIQEHFSMSRFGPPFVKL